jgi:hypothetical protein
MVLSSEVIMESVDRVNRFTPIFLLIYLIGSSVLSVASYALFSNSAAVVVTTVLIYVLLFGGSLLFYPVRPFRRADALGFHRVPFKSVVLSFLLGFLVQPTLLLISYLSQFLFRDLVSSSISSMMDLSVPVLLLITAILPAFFEELLCRGLILRSYREENLWVGILVSAIFFALLHGNIQQSLYAFAAGLLFGYMAQITQSIWPSMITHCTVNGSQILLYAFTSGLTDSADAALEATEEAAESFSWLTTASYASWMIVTLPLVILCIRSLRRTPEASAPTAFRWPSFRSMWPFYLYILLALGICLLTEILGA